MMNTISSFVNKSVLSQFFKLERFSGNSFKVFTHQGQYVQINLETIQGRLDCFSALEVLGFGKETQQLIYDNAFLETYPNYVEEIIPATIPPECVDSMNRVRLGYTRKYIRDNGGLDSNFHLLPEIYKAWVDRDERKGQKPSDHAPVLATFEI